MNDVTTVGRRTLADTTHGGNGLPPYGSILVQATKVIE